MTISCGLVVFRFFFSVFFRKAYTLCPKIRVVWNCACEENTFSCDTYFGMEGVGHNGHVAEQMIRDHIIYIVKELLLQKKIRKIGLWDI
jgi:hypothetical protein